jgi:cytoskeletal protein CcmA (bactofilin family)
MSMWKKSDRPDEPQYPIAEPPRQTSVSAQAAAPAPAQAQSTPQAPSASPAPRAGGGPAAVIGPSITVKGDVIGEEDLVIDGRVEGEIKVNRHAVTVGRNGRIKADIHAKSIQVEGEVLGNLWGDEAVVIRRTGKVQGNVTAPRVTLEDGSTFRGSIDMQPPQASDGRKQAPAARTEEGTSGAHGSVGQPVAHAAQTHGNPQNPQNPQAQGQGNQRRERTA